MLGEPFWTLCLSVLTPLDKNTVTAASYFGLFHEVKGG